MFEDIHSVGKYTHIIETMIIEKGHTQSICLEPASVYNGHIFTLIKVRQSALLKKGIFISQE